MNEPPLKLSATGTRRRDEILQQCRHELERHRHRRQMRRAGAALGCTVCLVAAAWWLAQPTASRPADPGAADRPLAGMPAAPASRFAPRRVVVSTRDTHSQSYLAHTREFQSVRWESLGNEQLLEALKDAGQPSHLARIGGELKVISRRPLGLRDNG